MNNFNFIFIFFISINIFSQENYFESYHDGRLIKEITKNGTTVTTSLRQIERDDGKYFTFDVAIINNSDRTYNFKSNGIAARIYAKNGKSISINALTRKEYLKIKKRRANFRTGLVAFAGGVNAANAGYSSSTTNTNSYGSYSGTANTNSSASAYGSGGYAYGTGNSTTNYSGNLYGSSTSTTNSYNGAAAYAAQQNESAKIQRMVEMSNEAKWRWNDEYIKNNTLSPQSTTTGLINVKFYKAVKVDLNVKVDNNNFTFEWDPNDSEF